MRNPWSVFGIGLIFDALFGKISVFVIETEYLSPSDLKSNFDSARASPRRYPHVYMIYMNALSRSVKSAWVIANCKWLLRMSHRRTSSKNDRCVSIMFSYIFRVFISRAAFLVLSQLLAYSKKVISMLWTYWPLSISFFSWLTWRSRSALDFLGRAGRFFCLHFYSKRHPYNISAWVSFNRNQYGSLYTSTLL